MSIEQLRAVFLYEIKLIEKGSMIQIQDILEDNQYMICYNTI